MVHTPGLVERRVHIARDELIADVTLTAEQLEIVRFAIGQALLLVVAAAQERFFTFCTNCLPFISLGLLKEGERERLVFDQAVFVFIRTDSKIDEKRKLSNEKQRN